jgi:hypothetical protein
MLKYWNWVVKISVSGRNNGTTYLAGRWWNFRGRNSENRHIGRTCWLVDGEILGAGIATIDTGRTWLAGRLVEF